MGERGQHRRRGDDPIIGRWPAIRGTTKSDRRRHRQGVDEFAQIARGREVLVLFGHLHLLHTVHRRQPGDHRVHEIVGRGCSRRHSHGAVEIFRKFVGRVHPYHHRAARLPREALQSDRIRGVHGTDHHDGVASVGDMHQRRLAVGGGKTEIASAGLEHVWETRLGRLQHARPVAVGQRGLCQQRHRLVEIWERRNVGGGLHPRDRIGCHRHRAHRLLVALMTDVDDPVALAASHLHLVVHLGDQWTHRVDHVAAGRSGRGHHVGGRAVGAQHDRPAWWHLTDVVDEHHTLGHETVDHCSIVHDLVVAVDGRLAATHQPGQRLDRHLHPGAEPSRRAQQHVVDSHTGNVNRNGRTAECVATRWNR